ncbi:MAG: hypothetical protein LBS68_01385 [Puniceicoccales bacterium]|jgi:hypothetical protein|nr:hypothetical protein [Puniceicoccales bacterium]
MDAALQTEKRVKWCVVVLDANFNWWVEESNWIPEYVDEDDISILDPRQIEYVFDLLEPLREFGLQCSVVERAFLLFTIDRDLGDGRIRLLEVQEKIGESEEKLFALPNIFNEAYGGYAEFLDHISFLRIKYLNSVHRFTQQLTVAELEEEVRESAGVAAGEGSMHLFQEVAGILEYCPAGFSDEDPGDEGGDDGKEHAMANGDPDEKEIWDS